ncbi:MAG TPA: hypothetical protein VEU96_03235 [Bryobacteraceae bacterium]|nr:hypothetical protein [Bryobacteraceae bacterium]
MFGLTKTAPYHDEILGALKRSGKHWKGSLALEPHGAVELILSGDRSRPDSASLALARELPEQYADLRPEIQISLFEHYVPYREAVTQGAFPRHVSPFPEIPNAEAIWPHVTVRFVRIEPLLTAGQMVDTVEVAYKAEWDEEHTLGARMQEWRLIELCGSV